MRGFKFHNGQIVGDLETRPTDKDHVKDYYGFDVRPVASASSGSRLYTAEFPNLEHSADDSRTDDADSDPFRVV